MEWVGEVGVLGVVPLRDDLGRVVRMLWGGGGGWWGVGSFGVSCWSGDRVCGSEGPVRAQDKDGRGCAAIRPCVGVHTEERRTLSGRRCKRICSCRCSFGIGLLEWMQSDKESRGVGSSVLSRACGGVGPASANAVGHLFHILH